MTPGPPEVEGVQARLDDARLDDARLGDARLDDARLGDNRVEAVQAWLDENWDEALTVREWWRRLAGAGYAYPTWPVGLGGLGTTTAHARQVTAVLGRNRVVGPPVGQVAATLAAPTILDYGDDEQIAELVPHIASGEAAWCQLFSEPGSGSDLASVATTARLDGDDWVVNGQKVWSSGADSADVGMLLARTDADVPKHHGITYFLIDMQQPGVEVRPLRQMNGLSSFCEVFLTDARVPARRVLGDVNGGWAVARTTLRHERNAVATARAPGLVPAKSGSRGDLDRTVGEIVAGATSSDARRPVIRGAAVPSEVLRGLAREYGRTADAVLRQDLVRYISHVRVTGWTMRRSAAAGGRLTGADGSIAKLATSRICQASRELSYRIIGADGLLTGPESPLAGELQTVALGSPATRLGGGTDEVQLTVLGERALGLPREPSADRDVPYRQLRVGTQRPER